MAGARKVLVGRILGAHGIRGEVKLASFTAEPAAIATYSPFDTARGARIEIVRLRASKDGFIAVLKGVSDRTAAEALKGIELFIDRDRLPPPAEGEVYHVDLIGRPVALADGASLGEVAGIENYGAGDLLDVRIEGRADSVLIPLSSRFVTLEADRIVAHLPDGYLDRD